MKANKISSLVFSVMALSAGMAHAGAGAIVNACVYFATKPATPLTVNVTPGGAGTHCMDDTGKAATITVTNAGLSCASVGYVEDQASGNLCSMGKSMWPLSYTVQGTAYSGTTQTQWHTGHHGFHSNSIELVDQSAGTNVCGQEALCSSTSWTWDAGTQGPLYIVFQPGYTGK